MVTNDDVGLFQELNVKRNFVVAGRNGRPAFFNAIVNAKMGNYFNASKSYVDLQTAGGVTGLLSAHVMELKLPSTVQTTGHLTIAEHELVCAASTTVNANISMAWYQVSGDNTARQNFLDTGSLFELTGFDEASGNIFSAGAGNPAVTGTLRIKIDDVNYYILLASGEAT